MGRDLLYPTWREAPEAVVALAALSQTAATAASRNAEAASPAARVSGGDDYPAPGRTIDSAAAEERRRRAVTAIEATIGGGPAGAVRRLLFHFVIVGAQRYYVVRENMRYHADYVLARLREVALAVGERAVAAGCIAEPLDVCFLRFDEIRRALAGDAALATLIAERRAAFVRDGTSSPPAMIWDGEARAVRELAARTANDHDVLRGEGAAPGRHRGRARIIRGPADFDRIAPRDVLVASYTDPGWTTLLALAGGLVLEAGGLLSHGAIVARELGIPAVVNVPAAMEVIHDGDTVVLDGTSGSVSIIERA